MDHGKKERIRQADTLMKIISPVLTHGADGTLFSAMPKGDEDKWARANKDKYAALEAVGRTLCGAAPWLNTKQSDPYEEEQRQKYADLARKTIADITDPDSPDYRPFGVTTEENGGNPFCQSLVDAAFLSQGIIRGKEELFDKLPDKTKKDLIRCLADSRKVRPAHNNWLLFSGMVEAALFTLGEEPDLMRVDYCLSQHEQWYKGDGAYGDGAAFHFDYYNSYVILPMIVDIARIFEPFFPEGGYGRRRYEQAKQRSARYAAVLERLIAPDGTFPPVGRSITYRTGAFHALSQAAYLGNIPEGLHKAQIREALGSVIRRCFDGDGNFYENGFLKTGLCGDQPGLGELYICAGSLYLCTTGFLQLGLTEDDEFWSSPYEPPTSALIWSGKDHPADHAIN